MTKSIAILGAGLMGTAIAATHLRIGFDVFLYDIAEQTLRDAPKRVAEVSSPLLFGKRTETCDVAGCPHPSPLPQEEGTLRCTSQIEQVLDCPIIIETITEKRKAKQKLYRAIQNGIEASGRPFPCLFTNTSTISIASLAEELHPEQAKKFLGFHFFHPVRERSLVEIIPGAATELATVLLAKDHAARIQKHPIQVGDGPGFLVNRILNPYLTGALQLLLEGVEMQRIERVATDFGMNMGPFRIMDEIGLDVVLHAGWVLYRAFPDRVPRSPILMKLVEMQRLGRKTGAGFMRYETVNSWDGDPVPDPVFDELLRGMSNGHHHTDISDTEIEKRLIDSMRDEAIRCFEDGVIIDLADADWASVHALGFPPTKKLSAPQSYHCVTDLTPLSPANEGVV